MIKFIELTCFDGRRLRLKVDIILNYGDYFDNAGKSFISTETEAGEDCWYVKESVEQIDKLIFVNRE